MSSLSMGIKASLKMVALTIVSLSISRTLKTASGRKKPFTSMQTKPLKKELMRCYR